MVTYPTFLVPFCTWLLMGYFRTIPREVEECALVDGATRMQTLVAHRAADGDPRDHLRGCSSASRSAGTSSPTR